MLCLAASGPSARRVSANEPLTRPIGEQLIGILLAWLGKTALLVRVLDIRNARVRLPERTCVDDCPVTVVPTAYFGCRFNLSMPCQVSDHGLAAPL